MNQSIQVKLSNVRLYLKCFMRLLLSFAHIKPSLLIAIVNTAASRPFQTHLKLSAVQISALSPVEPEQPACTQRWTHL